MNTSPPKIQIDFVSALCGLGKSQSAAEFIPREISRTNVIYIAPSEALIVEMRARLEALGIEVTEITGRTNHRRVRAAIVARLKNLPPSGEVILITWQAYSTLPFFPHHINCIKIIDEIPQLDNLHTFRLPRNWHHITNFFELGFWSNGVVADLKCDRKALKRHMRKVGDTAEKPFADFYRDALNDNKRLFVDIETWNRIIEQNHVSNVEDENDICFISMLNHNLFKDAILLGANIENSLLYKWFTKFYDCQFVEQREIVKALRPPDPALGARLKISYLIENRRASKYLFGQDLNGSTVLMEMERIAIDALQGERFLFVVNNGRENETLFAKEANGKPLPVMSHGLNSYANYTNLCFFAAQNRSPKHLKLLTALGLDRDTIFLATSGETIYQAGMRTALRDRNSTASVHLIVPDNDSAEYVAKLIGSSNLSKLGDLDLHQLKPLTQIQKTHRFKAKKSLDKLFTTKQLPSSPIKEDGIQFDAFHDSDVVMGGNNITCDVTFHRDLFVTEPPQLHIQSFSVGGFIKFLKEQSRNVVEDKDQLALCNPATFDFPDNAERFEKLRFFKSSAFMALDFDQGKLTPDDFIRIFYTEAIHGTRHSFVIHNSFSRSAEQPNRFRVFLFYKRPATSIERHRAVFDYVEDRLANAGFWPKDSGLDRIACRSGVQSFYLPCTNRRITEKWSFCEAYGVTSRDFERMAIDPSAFEKTALPRPKPKQHVVDSSQAKCSDAELNKIGSELSKATDNRYVLTFQAGLKYRASGLDINEVEARLRVDLPNDYEKKEKRIKDTMKSLKTRGRSQ